MADKNKVKFGLKNVYYAALSEAIVNGDVAVTYETPKRIRGAVNITLSPAGETVEFAADDDAAYYEENTNNGYEGSLEIALVPDHFRETIMGDKFDANDALVENKDAKVKKFALLFEFDGDANKTRHVLYNVLAARPDVAGATTSKTKEPQPETLNITARPAPDTGNVKAKVTADSNAYANFFASVYEEAEPENTAPATAAFSDADVDITVTSSAANEIASVAVDGRQLGHLDLTIAGLKVTIKEAIFTNLDDGAHAVSIALRRGNPVHVTVTKGSA